MPTEPMIYFASDLHLGMQTGEESLERERIFVRWLEEIRKDATELWLLGDVFDYWFEYAKVVPRGFTRFLGKLAELSDQGIGIHLIPGNHDIWIFDYLPKEVGMEIHTNPVERSWNGQRFHMGHGDGLHRGDRLYRFLQGMFKNRILQWLYARIHPNGSMAFAHWWSKRSRINHGTFGKFLGPEKEHQIQFARNMLESDPGIRFFLFGHRHIAYDIRIGEECRVLCLGDWIGNFTYALFDGKDLQLKKFLPGRGEIIRL